MQSIFLVIMKGETGRFGGKTACALLACFAGGERERALDAFFCPFGVSLVCWCAERLFLVLVVVCGGSMIKVR